jgi:hypothetical protein
MENLFSCTTTATNAHDLVGMGTVTLDIPAQDCHHARQCHREGQRRAVLPRDRSVARGHRRAPHGSLRPAATTRISALQGRAHTRVRVTFTILVISGWHVAALGQLITASQNQQLGYNWLSRWRAHGGQLQGVPPSPKEPTVYQGDRGSGPPRSMSLTYHRGANNTTLGFWSIEDSCGLPLARCCIGGTSLSTPVRAGISKLIAQLEGDRSGT